MHVAIEEIEIPGGPHTASWSTYAEHLAVRNHNEADVLGAAAAYVDPAESLAYFQDQIHTAKRLYIAWNDGTIVGQALFEHSRDPEDRTAWIFGGVLADARCQGIGTALFDRVEQDAITAGCRTFQSFVLHGPASGGSWITARTGFGQVPADDPGVR